MGTKTVKKADTQINYNFLLKCMMGFTAAAVVTATALALMAKSSTVGFVATSAAFTGPIGALTALIGLTALIAAACCLPLFCGMGNRAVVYNNANPYYYNRPWGWSLFAPSAVYTGGVVHSHHGAGRVHSHGGSIFSGGTTHTHGGRTTHTHGGGTTHVHGGGGAIHTHGGGVHVHGGAVHTHAVRR